jgi:myosin heavy subunit
MQKPFNQIQAEDVRESIIQALYGGVFRAIIDQINKSIGESSSRSR